MLSGIVLLGVGGLILFSLIGHNSSDPPSGDYLPTGLTRNPCGMIGAYISYYAFYNVGYAAYAVAGLLVLWGYLDVTKKAVQRTWLVPISAAVLLVALSGLLSPPLISFWRIQNIPSAGGNMGFRVARGMILLFARPGAIAVLLAIVLIALHYSTSALSWRAAVVAARGARAIARVIRRVCSSIHRVVGSPFPLRVRAEREEAPAVETVGPESSGERDKPVAMPPPVGIPFEQPDLQGITIEPQPQPLPSVRLPKPTKTDRSSKVKKAEGEYVLPSADLLDFPETVDRSHYARIVREQAEKLQQSLNDFGVVAQVVSVQTGPVITQYELSLAPGTKVQKLHALSDDIAMALKAPSVRIVAPIPGKSTAGVEVPNAIRAIVRLRELMNFEDSKLRKYQVPFFLGKDASGVPLLEDLTEMPHVLIAGCTGSGKSVCLNSVVMSILMTRRPDEVKLILIDPKMVELSSFAAIPHLMCPVVTDMKKAAEVLEWAVEKMDERYTLLSRAGVKHIRSYNRLSREEVRKRLGIDEDEDVGDVDVPYHMPYIILIVDELADLMFVAAKDVEEHVTRLAQKSRAVGIHVVLATQRPSVDVITGLIKSNMPARISFQVSAKVDSRTILDQNGAEKLLGEGDMLFLPPATARLARAQGTYVSEEEIARVMEATIEAGGEPQFAPELVQARRKLDVDPRELDDMYDEALRMIVESGRGSVSLLQRGLGIGYTRAARLVDLMYSAGVVGEYKGSMAREVLIKPEELEAMVGAEGEGQSA